MELQSEIGPGEARNTALFHPPEPVIVRRAARCAPPMPRDLAADLWFNCNHHGASLSQDGPGGPISCGKWQMVAAGACPEGGDPGRNRFHGGCDYFFAEPVASMMLFQPAICRLMKSVVSATL